MFLWKSIKRVFIIIIKLLLSAFCGLSFLLIFGFIMPQHFVFIYILGFLISFVVIFLDKGITQLVFNNLVYVRKYVSLLLRRTMGNR